MAKRSRFITSDEASEVVETLVAEALAEEDNSPGALTARKLASGELAYTDISLSDPYWGWKEAQK
jgi:hypothetical protein